MVEIVSLWLLIVNLFEDFKILNFMLNDWAAFIGRFHPVLVHLPIGFLLIAALLEIGRLLNKISVTNATISFILFWSGIGASLSCVAGYLLSLGGGYNEHLLDEHKWQGIWVAVASWLAWAMKSEVLANILPVRKWIYAPALVFGTFMTMVAGHHGGSLTHGEDYLTQATPEPFRSWLGIAPKTNKTDDKIKPIADLNKAMVYQDVVQPILKQSCVQCHNASKSKGDLRMDEVALLQKGGEHGPIYTINKAAESEMIKRCLLPLDDEHHMPPKGKNQLTDSQIALLSWWIDEGASFDKKATELKQTDAIKPVLAALVTGAAVATVATATTTESPVFKLSVPAPDSKVVESLKKTGLLVMPLSSSEPNLLEINAVNVSTLNDVQMAMLEPLAENIVWLKLGDTKITDKSLATILKLKNLQKLHLENTTIGDNALKGLDKLPYLDYLNLVGTTVTDAGIANLATSKSLKQLYLWHTKATEASKKALPLVEVVLGTSEADVAEFVKLGAKAPKAVEAKK
jgi:uncharacterized membrane protein/mono/diheme cytochrome c family protein/SepF-like predicted cell division protein (DUF552 family)